MGHGSVAALPRAGGHGVHHRWKVLGVGFAANASFSAAFSGIPTTAVFLRSGYRLDNHSLGLVLGMLGLGIAVSELPWGLLTDRWGDRRVLLLGLLSTAAALAGLALFAAPHGAHVPGVAVLALFGNIVTAWSWFGVNMLGVGLHSYGFMDAAFWWLVAFVVSQLALMLIASVPRTSWRSAA